MVYELLLNSVSKQLREYMSKRIYKLLLNPYLLLIVLSNLKAPLITKIILFITMSLTIKEILI